MLRPDRRRAGARLRQGLPDRVDPVRPGGRAARAGPAAGRASCRRRGSPARGCTWRIRTTASAAAARSSCCWTSRRCTGCRRTRWSPRGTCPGCGSTWPPPRVPCCSAAWPPRCAGTCAHEPGGRARDGGPARRTNGPPASGNGVPAGVEPGLAARVRERFGVHGRGQHERDQAGRADRPRACTTRPASRGGHGRRHGGRGGRGGEQLVVPRARPDSYYGKPIIKEPVWGSRDVAGLPVLRRAGRCLLGAGRVRPGGRQPPAGPGVQDRRGRGHRPVRGGPGGRPGPAGALPEHAARVQAHLADERRLLADLRVRRGRRRPRRPAR